MNLRQGIRYYLKSYRNSIVIFYLVIACVLLIGLLLQRVLGSSVVEEMLETATKFFLLVAGMNSFKEELGLFLQTGHSRKTLFLSFLCNACIISLGMALIDWLYHWPLRNVLHTSMLYEYMFANGQIAGLSLPGILYSFMLNLLALTTGFFVTTLYYRMNRGLKIAVSVGAGALLFVGLPLIEIFTGGLMQVLIGAGAWLLGYGGHVLRAMLVLLCSCALMSGLSFLLVRRAPLKAE